MSVWTRWVPCLVVMALLAVLAVGEAHAASSEPYRKEEAFLKEIAFDQRLGEQVPTDLVFRDETGRSVTLGSYFGQKPVIMLMTYYTCPMLCPLLLDGLVRSLRGISFDIGNEFTVLTVSINPRETPTMAATKKELYVQRYGRAGAAEGWHFLTSPEESLRRLTQAVGFRYVYDATKDEYAHATGILLLTPAGQISRYLYGIEFSPRDLRLALVEAAANTIGSPVDQLLLYCYRYDPLAGKYGLVIMNVLRVAGAATVAALGAFMFVMFRRDRRAALAVREAR
jgi:protein SCO1/2